MRKGQTGSAATHLWSDLGFSVLEAMVAMALIAAAFLPLLALQGQFVRTVDSLQRADARMSIRENVVAYISSVNLTHTPDGEFMQNSYTVKWQAVPATAPRLVRDQAGGAGRFELTLFEVSISVEDEGRIVETFQFKSLGWRPLVSIANSF